MLVGAFQILIAVFKLGDLTRYISESVILGFLLAAAILIAIGQLGNALGVKDQGNGRQSVLKRTYLTLFHGDAFNYRALIISTATVVLAILLRRLVKRFGLPQLDLLAVLIIAALIAYFSPDGRPKITPVKTAVTLTAKIPQSLPLPHIPSVQLARSASCPRARWPSRSSACSRRCRSPKPLPTRADRRSTTTGRSSRRAWRTSPVASSRPCRARVR